MTVQRVRLAVAMLLVVASTFLVGPPAPADDTLRDHAAEQGEGISANGYNIHRNGTPTNTASTTSTTVTGSTAHQFFVRARDAAGNLSPQSNTPSVTAQNQWGNGYIVHPITVTSIITSWTVTFTLSAGHAIAGWNAALTSSGQTITTRNMSYNGTLDPNASTTFGDQASRPHEAPLCQAHTPAASSIQHQQEPSSIGDARRAPGIPT